MTYKQWDIVAVPFPFVEKAVKKRRPALIISTSRMHSKTGFYWLAMITSQKETLLDDDILFKNYKACGLSKPSIVRLSKLSTLMENDFIRKVGTADRSTKTAINKLLKTYLGLKH